MERNKRKKNRNITYRQGNFNPELDAHIFNKMNGTAQFDGFGGGLAEDYDDYGYDDYGQNPAIYSIMISSGHGTVKELMGGFESYDEAYDALEILCVLRPYGWAYIDRNGFEWDAFIDEDEEKW